MGAAAKASTNWGNPKTLARHFRDHGADFGAKSADDYAQQASDFFWKSQADHLPTKIDANGVIRVYDPKTNTFASFNSDGTTKTFYKPNPNKHGLPSNLDYWAQPGSFSMTTGNNERMCPVCGFTLWFQPWRGASAADEICPSCGIQFGLHDAAGGDVEKRAEIYKEWRKKWIARGMPWDSAGIEEPPKDWDPQRQLDRLGKASS